MDVKIQLLVGGVFQAFEQEGERVALDLRDEGEDARSIHGHFRVDVQLGSEEIVEFQARTILRERLQNLGAKESGRF